MRYIPDGGGGGGGVSIPNPTDAFSLGINNADAVPTESDAATFLISLLQNDTNVIPTETTRLTFPSSNFGDTSAEPTETRTLVVRSWATGCVDNDASKTVPANADNTNDLVFATVKTALSVGDLTNPVTLDTGSMNVPSLTVVSGKITVWFKCAGFAGTLADTFFIGYTTGGGPAGHVFDSPAPATVNWPGVDYSIIPLSTSVSLTLAQWQALVLRASYTAVVVATPTTSIQVDAFAADVTATL